MKAPQQGKPEVRTPRLKAPQHGKSAEEGRLQQGESGHAENDVCCRFLHTTDDLTIPNSFGVSDAACLQNMLLVFHVQVRCGRYFSLLASLEACQARPSGLLHTVCYPGRGGLVGISTTPVPVPDKPLIELEFRKRNPIPLVKWPRSKNEKKYALWCLS